MNPSINHSIPEEKVRLGPPPRWLKCPRKGQIIAGKFIPMKTPLCSSYDRQVPEAYRFPPGQLFDFVKGNRSKVGLWIDLTNTDRFYSRAEIEEKGCQYVKLNCRGHGESPSQAQTETFVNLCKNFIAQNPTDLIAVHCTHGFNRTGFLICSYLVMALDWGVDAAVIEYAKVRPPGIYKGDYLKEIFTRYGDADDCPEAPPLPDWCDESEPILNDDEAEGSSNGMQATTSSVSKIPEFAPPIPSVKPVPSGPKLARLQKQCQEWCGWKGKGFPGSQPVSMTQQNMQFLAEHEYMVSWKADGFRYMMMIDGPGEIYMFDRDHNCFHIPQLRFPHRKDPRGRHIKGTLLEGEMVIDKLIENGVEKEFPRFLLYDIVKFEEKFNDKEIAQANYKIRLECIDHEIVRPRHVGMEQGLIDKSKEPFSVRLKMFRDIYSGIEEFLSEDFAKKLPHEIDGLICQPKYEPYTPGRDQKILKWKPPSLNSVDFQLKIVKEAKEGMFPEWVGYLYVLGLDQPFAFMKPVTKELRQFDKKIIECKFEQNRWVMLRERKDKSYPNAFQTASGVCESIRNPISKEMLLDFVKTKAKKPAAKNENQRKDQDMMPPPKLPKVG